MHLVQKQLVRKVCVTPTTARKKIKEVIIKAKYTQSLVISLRYKNRFFSISLKVKRNLYKTPMRLNYELCLLFVC